MGTCARSKVGFRRHGLVAFAVATGTLAALVQALPGPVWAAYANPAAMVGSTAGAFDEVAFFNAQLNSHLAGNEQGLSAALSKQVLTDSQNRISNEFKVPPEIKNNVEFWFKIYAQYSTRNIVLFDSKHPEIIYEALDFSDLAATARNKIVYELVSKKAIATKIKKYKAAFARLMKNPRPRKPTPEEANILAALKKIPHKHSFKDLAGTFRSQTGQRDNVIAGLATAEDFFPKMEKVFAGFDLPKELVRLSLVESSFNVGVTSRVGAAGVWQFMPDSAKEYLLVHPASKIDERLSPLKSTVAAAKLLKRNRRILGNWALAVTSYNHGMRHLRNIASRTSDEFRSVAHVFKTCGPHRHGVGWASRNYYAEFLAMVHAEAYRDLLYNDLRKPNSRAVTFAELKAPTSLSEFAMSRGLSLHEMVQLNQEVGDFRVALPRGFILTIPSQQDEIDLLISRSRFYQPPKLNGRSLTGGFSVASHSEQARKKRGRR
ncbi:MAG: hypothetical protein A2X94_09530 [Bdellovibrionales bacterium GWB1_55_8]|nr:MAG: hypothetical protein A2X94_09530 [Bdellovibrionales bacterium GWB1_55_8]